MAENGNGKMSRENKEFLVESGIKIGLTIWAVSVLSKWARGDVHIFTDPGRTDRLTFDLEKTQNRYYPLGNDEWEAIPDPWNPADIARRAHTIFNGLTVSARDHINIYNEISQLGYDRARWLHNYWLDEIDPQETLYRWIEDEWVRMDPILPQEDKEERAAKDEVMKNLRNWGAGF